MNVSTNILIADDHKMFRDGIKAILTKEKDFRVVADVNGIDSILEALEGNHIDIILMDIDMGKSNGIDAAIKVRNLYPEIKILALSMHGEHNYVIKMLEAGASGYILKNAGKDEMINAIKSVAAGDSYFSKEVSNQLLEHLNIIGTGSDKSENIPLTNRELEILKMIAQEYSNSEIADMLFISIRTVDTHRRNLIEKLGVKNTAGLVKYAIKKGLVD